MRKILFIREELCCDFATILNFFFIVLQAGDDFIFYTSIISRVETLLAELQGELDWIICNLVSHSLNCSISEWAPKHLNRLLIGCLLAPHIDKNDVQLGIFADQF